MGRDGVDSITIRYELDGPGIESGLKRDFPHKFGPDLGTRQLHVQSVPRLFLEAKAAGTQL